MSLLFSDRKGIFLNKPQKPRSVERKRLSEKPSRSLLLQLLLRFTFVGSVISYMFSNQNQPVISNADTKTWAAALVTTVVLLVAGVLVSGHQSIEFVKQKLHAVSSIILMSSEELLGF